MEESGVPGVNIVQNFLSSRKGWKFFLLFKIYFYILLPRYCNYCKKLKKTTPKQIGIKKNFPKDPPFRRTHQGAAWDEKATSNFWEEKRSRPKTSQQVNGILGQLQISNKTGSSVIERHLWRISKHSVVGRGPT